MTSMGIKTSVQIITSLLVGMVLMACFNEEKFDVKYNIPSSHSRTTNKYTEEQFFDNAAHYQKGKNEIRIGASPLQASFFEGDKIYFDPHRVVTSAELQLSSLLFPRLVTLTPNGVVVPMIATSWEETKLSNGYTYIFHIGDMKWGDGRSITAKQVQASIIRALDPLVKNPHAAALALAIRGAFEYYGLENTLQASDVHRLENRVQVNAVDDNTLYVTASSQEIDVLKALAHPIAAVLPIVSADYKNKEIFDLTPNTWIRKGAYIPVDIGRERIALQSTEYWGKELWLDTVDFFFISSMDERISRFNNEEIDWVDLPLGMDANDVFGFEGDGLNTALLEHVQRVEYVAEVYLDIPDFSILRKVFIARETLESINNDFTKINYKLMLSEEAQERMHSELGKIIQHIVARLYRLKTYKPDDVFIADKIFLPNTILPSVKDLQVSEEDESTVITDTFLPEEIIADTIEVRDGISDLQSTTRETNSNVVPNVDITPLDTLQEALQDEIVSAYITTLKNFLQRGYENHTVLRVAYSDEFLKQYAEEITAYFSAVGVSVVLLEMLPQDNPAADTYDIAIRVDVSNEHTRIGMFSKLWWLWVSNDRSPVDIFGKFDRLLELAFYTDLEISYLELLNTINEDVIHTSRFVPMWYLPKKTLIRKNQYPWWTGHLIHHPMYIPNF